MVPVVVLGLVGAVFLAVPTFPLNKAIGFTLLGVSLILAIGLLHQFRQPRLAFRDGFVLFYLKAGSPIEVPVQIVEAFFLGTGPSHLPINNAEETKSMNLIARLSRRQPEWHEREVKQALGEWSDGYVLIRGTWCEPISEQVLNSLNGKLHQISKENQADQ